MPGPELLERIDRAIAELRAIRDERAAQAVNRPCHDDIEFPPASVLEHGDARQNTCEFQRVRPSRNEGATQKPDDA